MPAGPVSWIRVIALEKGKYPDLFVAFLAMTCFHCLQPKCVAACPVNAITKREQDGIVIVDREVCTGKDCALCLESCPYGAPQFGAEENAKMQKCDLCMERWTEGKKPICVAACPMRALDAGSVEELRVRYGDVREAEGFVYSEDLAPSIILKPKKGPKGFPVRKTDVAF